MSATVRTAAAAAIAAAATIAATAALGHGRGEVGVLFQDEIKLLALGFELPA